AGHRPDGTFHPASGDHEERLDELLDRDAGLAHQSTERFTTSQTTRAVGREAAHRYPLRIDDRAHHCKNARRAAVSALPCWRLTEVIDQGGGERRSGVGPGYDRDGKAALGGRRRGGRADTCEHRPAVPHETFQRGLAHARPEVADG